MRAFRQWNRGARRTAIAGLVAAAVVAVPAAQAAKPSVKPVPNTTSVLAAKHACSFKVIDKVLPESQRVERVFANGRHLVTGPAKDRLTNPKSGTSIVRNTSGRVSFRKGDDGNTRYVLHGPQVLYFYPGDEGPGGKAGENGGLYQIVGTAKETLDKSGVVTAFTLNGKATELCSVIS